MERVSSFPESERAAEGKDGGFYMLSGIITAEQSKFYIHSAEK